MRRIKLTMKRKAKSDNVPMRNVRRKASEAPYIPEKCNPENIIVIVGSGDNAQRFSIHQELLTAHSEFFRAALRGDCKEAREQQIFLEEDRPEDFQTFHQFLVTGFIFTSDNENNLVEEETPKGRYAKNTEACRLMNVWSLAQKLLSTSLKDAVTDACVAKVIETGRHPINARDGIYPRSAAMSGMRKFLVDVAVWEWTLEDVTVQEQDDDWNQFFYDVAVAQKERNSSDPKARNPFKHREPCRYHEHVADGSRCYLEMFESERAN